MREFTLLLRKNKSFMTFFILVLLFVLISIFAPYLAPNDPLRTNMANALGGRSSEFPLGTDNLGRCILSRLLYGAQSSLKMTLSLVVVASVFGTVMGVIAGYFGGIYDSIIMRVSDVFLAFPGIILAIAVAGILGPSSVNAVIALSLVNWVKYARMGRSLVMTIKKKDYIKTARMGGAAEYQIIGRYILPNIIPTLVILASTDIGTMMLEISSLSFLGLGTQPPTPEWGYMLKEGTNYMQISPELMIYPGIAIVLFVMIFNLWGDSIRDILDPNKEH